MRWARLVACGWWCVVEGWLVVLSVVVERLVMVARFAERIL
jgi:hypothetical protein